MKVCNTYTDIDSYMNVPKPVPSTFYHDMVSYLYEQATRCIYPKHVFVYVCQIFIVVLQL